MKKKKNMIIGGLLALIFLMSVGYAAFATNLNISGTANTSSWIIKITNIREKTKTSGADTINTSYTDLSASFSSTLTKPGDSITYEVTVENQGNIDAVLKQVTKTFTQNRYIDVTYSGLLEGQMLYKQGQAGSSAVMEVTVTFKDIEIESLTDTITSNITISLDFEQEGNNVDTTTKYLVAFDSQGGTVIESKYVKWSEYDLASDVNSTKLGHNLNGWYTQPNGFGTMATAVREYADLANNDETQDGIILYAFWVPKKYTINYDGQGSTSSLSSSSYGWTSNNIIRSKSPTKKGYTRDSWYTAPNGGGLKIDTNTTVSDVVQYLYGRYNDVASGTNGNEVTLYMNWIPKEYTLQFNSQGGSEINQVQTLTWIDPIALPDNPTKEGYTFGGWWTKLSSAGVPTSTAKELTNGKSISELFTSDNNANPLTLYAYWIENE